MCRSEQTFRSTAVKENAGIFDARIVTVSVCVYVVVFAQQRKREENIRRREEEQKRREEEQRLRLEGQKRQRGEEERRRRQEEVERARGGNKASRTQQIAVKVLLSPSCRSV